MHVSAVTQAKPLRTNLRWMIRRDMSQVMAIEEASFKFPWSEDDFVKCRRSWDTIGMVAEVDDHKHPADERIAGFIVYRLHKTRLHVLNFAVARAFRRQGVGMAMAKTLTGKLGPDRRVQVSLEIPESNLGAQLFFRAAGFRAVGVLRGYYDVQPACRHDSDDTPEDAYVMQYRLPAAAGQASQRK